MSYYAIETLSSKTTNATLIKALDQGKFGIYPMGNPKSSRYRLMDGSKYANKKVFLILKYVKLII